MHLSPFEQPEFVKGSHAPDSASVAGPSFLGLEESLPPAPGALSAVPLSGPGGS
jgi:hypothetical protein